MQVPGAVTTPSFPRYVRLASSVFNPRITVWLNYKTGLKFWYQKKTSD